MSDSRVVGDKLMIEVGKAEEGSHILDFGRGWPGSNAIKFDRVHGKLTRFHDHSEVLDFRDVKLAFFKFQIEVELSHPLEDMVDLLGVGCWVWRGDEEVIHIDNQLSFSDHVSERVIHESLEYSGGVTQTKEHDCWFEKSFVCDKSHLPLMTIFDVDIVVPLLNIEFSEVASIFQLVHEVRDERERIGIMGGMFVKVMVVLAGVEFTVFFS